MMDELICKICGKKSKSLRGIYRHAKLVHNYTTKHYFDEFIEPFEHKCPYCGVNELHWWGYFYGKSCDAKECKFKAASNGFKNTNQSAKVEKIKQTKLLRYGSENYNNAERNKETLKRKYGTDCSFKIKEVKTLIKEKWNERYGGHPMKSKEVRMKLEESMIQKYGFRNASQVPNICSKKSKHKYNLDDYSFDSKAEFLVYKFCKENGLKVVYQPKSIEYKDSLSKSHQYIPDFEIEGKLYEVKGDYLLTNENKLYFPYRNTLTETELNEFDSRDEAKTQCMKDNHVTIIRTSQINELGKIIVK